MVFMWAYVAFIHNNKEAADITVCTIKEDTF